MRAMCTIGFHGFQSLEVAIIIWFQWRLPVFGCSTGCASRVNRLPARAVLVPQLGVFGAEVLILNNCY